MTAWSWQHAVKRAIDILASAAGLIALWPVLVIVGFRVWRTMGWPILFRQERPGLDAKPFTMRKFRTMRDAIGPDGQPLPDAERLTDFGRFLRRTSLDELPELWNVLCGDMSLVGPRPLLMEYLERYTPEQARRHEVRPGITGWAQVNGRNMIGWEEKFAYDVWYIDHWSLWFDAKILVKTAVIVARRHGISGHGVATMRHFYGPADRA